MEKDVIAMFDFGWVDSEEQGHFLYWYLIYTAGFRADFEGSEEIVCFRCTKQQAKEILAPLSALEIDPLIVGLVFFSDTPEELEDWAERESLNRTWFGYPEHDFVYDPEVRPNGLPHFNDLRCRNLEGGCHAELTYH